MKLRVLFVDDEPNVLNGLRLVLRSLRDKWHMAYATNAVEALGMLAGETFDVIISDMRMPGMDGGDLLAEVQQRYPHMLRIILSGYSDQAMIMKTVKPAHQFLSKPCNHKELEEVVERSMQLRGVLGNDRVRSILSDVEALPSLPEVYQALEAELGKENPSLQYLGDIIEQDMGLTVSLLKLVNSSFFGLRRHVSSPHQAVVLLGTETVKSLMLILALVKKFHVNSSLKVDASLLWQHSTYTGHLARCIAAKCQASKEMIDYSFIGGLLHDVGKLVLLTRFEKEYAEVLKLVREEGFYILDAEQRVFGTTHAEMGAYLLALWGLPAPVVEAVLRHDAPVISDEGVFTPLAAVHVANVLERQLRIIHEDYLLPQLHEEFVHSVGIAHRIDDLTEACRGMLDADDCRESVAS
ncbi:response regulator [Desulfovibrio mangrovi]|uniref:response regulator n=1 Tax=Desulfovibrio mangrovi TaxID=2976983 RepID=UPI002247CFF9|nr:response regulator [Desulfovibrio mangrovi]UZP67336.1 response regulator [Desulfovibrio mangrovi]